MKEALATISLTVALTAPLLAQSLTVSAQMDIYRAGGYNDGSGANRPAVFAFPAGAGHILTFSSVTGAWTCAGGVPEYGPDGTSTGACFHAGGQKFNNPIGPFAGYASSDFVEALTGMFLEDNLPVSPAPRLRFYDHDSSRGGIPTDFTILSPQIGQVFFIGDGLTGTGSGIAQVFRVPPTATHLYLGFTDNCGNSLNTAPGCYFDNAGSLTTAFRIQPEIVNWVQPALSLSPPGRCCAGMAYDQATHETVLFGGFGNPQYYGDTWAWRSGWTKLAPAASPSARSGPGMVWDGAAKNIVLFGGLSSDGTSLNDTWTWDGSTWTQQFPLTSPPARQFDTQGMAYDAATRTVVFFGGLDGSNYLGDTWTWDGAAKTWTQQFPAASPSPRRTTIAYDGPTGTVVLFGGDSSNNAAYNDTWTWNGATWTRQSPASAPSPRSMASMAYDASVGVVVLFGGSSGPGGQVDDTWTWNGAGWTEIHTANVPTARWAAAMDYDPLTQGLVLFAGFGTTTLDGTSLFIRVF